MPGETCICSNGNLLQRRGTMIHVTDHRGEGCKTIPVQDLVTFLDAEEARLAKDTFSGIPWPFALALVTVAVIGGIALGLSI